MSKLNKKEIRDMCKYFFECGEKQFNKKSFNNAFEIEWKSKLLLKKFAKEGVSEQ